ncbi:MAG: SDR family oxidoreductase [Gemmatimonadota bacterium]
MSERTAREPAVLVTGASKGIGTACALQLVRDGFRVYAGVRREEDGRALITQGGDGIVPILIDVTDADQIAAVAARIGEETGERGLHGIVNNAGVAIAGPLEYLPVEALRRQIEINFTGQIAVTQALLPLLRRCRDWAEGAHRGGRIVFMSSIAGRSALPFMGAYSASKFALEAAADALRIELRPFGITVSLVEPGVIATPIWDTARRAADDNLRSMPEEGERYYGRALDAVRRRLDRGVGGLAPEHVATVVSHALTARRPRVRYLVGRDARARAALQWLLPDRVSDRIVHEVVKRL